MTTVTANGAEWTYTLNGSVATITSFKNTTGLSSVVIPSSLDGYSVVSIADFAINRDRNGIYSITSVSFETPSSVTSIGRDFCAGLSFLTSVTIPSGVTTIGDYFLDDTRVASFTFPNTVTSIGTNCFLRSDMANISIPSSVTSLGVRLGADSSNITKKVTISTPILSFGFYVGTDLRTINLTSPSGSIVTFPDDAFNSLQKVFPATFNTTSAISTQLLQKRAMNADYVPINWTINALSKPSAPTLNSVTASINSSNGIDFSITESTDKGGANTLTYAIIATPSVGSPIRFSTTSLTGTMTGLTDGSSYTFVVVATNDLFTSDNSNSISFTLPSRPSAPINLSTLPPADGAILLSWQDPATTAVSIDYYIVTNTTTSQSVNVNYGTYSSGSTYSYNFTGLTNGTSYTFTIVGHNNSANINGPAASVTDFPAKAPSAPAKPSVSAGNTQVTVTWTAPSNGGGPITGYKVTYTDSSNNSSTVTFNSTATSQAITGLTNGTAYTFTVAAFTAKYTTGLNFSPSSDAITPYASLTAPTSFTATTGNGQVALTWYDPSPTNNYLTIDYYTVTNTTTSVSTNVNFVAGGGQYSYTFTGLTNGTVYSFTVKAHSSTVSPAVFGPTASASATPSSAPSAPAKPTAVAGNTSATISWSAPNNQGSAITGYTVTSTPGSFTATVGGGVLSTTISGLTNGIAYTFVVYATNANGNSANSPASDAVTPVVVPDPPTINSAASNGSSISVSWSAATSGVAADGYAVDVAYNGTTFGRVNAGLATSYSYTIPENAFNGYLFTAKVYAYKGLYATGAFSAATSKDVDDISHGLNFWLDASDIGAFSYGATTTLAGKKYSQVNAVIDKSSKGNNGTSYGLTGRPIYVFNSGATTLGEINTAGYATIPTWARNAGHSKPSILFRSGNQDYMAANLSSRNSPMTFLAVYINYGAYTSFGQAGDANGLIDYNGQYRFFMINGTGSSATFPTAPSELGYVIRSGYPNQANTSYQARINGTTYDTTGKAEGFNTFLINKRDDTAYGVTYNDILVSEVLIYNRALNDNELAMAEGYLAARWGLLSWLPAGHPYKAGYSGIIKTTPLFYSGSFEGFGPRDAISYLLNNTYDSYGIGEYFTAKTPSVPQAYINLRSELKKQLRNATDKQRGKGAIISTMINKNTANTFVVPSSDAASLANTLDSTSGFKNVETLVIVPTYTQSGGNYSATFTFSAGDWAYVTDTNKNFLFDVPVSTDGTTYSLTLAHGSSSITFTYNGSVLNDGSKTYLAGSTFVLDGQTVTLSGLGSGVGNGGGAGDQEGGGGGAGDPYVSTVSGISYKLPIMDGAIRFYQGNVDGELLTVNATLRTCPGSEFVAHNMRSLFAMQSTLGKKRMKAIMNHILEKEETLCFFEKLFISHNGSKLVIDVWDQKLHICDHAGVFPFKILSNDHRALTSTGIYSGYSGKTLEITVGKKAKIYISVYDSPIVRSGLYVVANDMMSGNGVIVNALSETNMTLSHIEDICPVSKQDAPVHRSIKETFIDHNGIRVHKMRQA